MLQPTNITRTNALEMLKTDSIPENAYLMVQGYGFDDDLWTGLYPEDYEDILDSPELTVFQLWTEDDTGNTFSEITFDQWIMTYKPVLNPNTDSQMFETYGEEVAFVKSQKPENIWTLVNDGDSNLILSGWHFVNRVGYYVTVIPVEQNTDVCVLFDDEEDN